MGVSVEGFANSERAESMIQTALDRETEREELDEVRKKLENSPAPAGDSSPGFAMTEDRRVGSTSIEYEGTIYRFGKMSGRASVEFLGEIEEMEEGTPVPEFADFIWASLESWSLNAEADTDFWADELGLMESVEIARGVALGGNE